MEYNPCSRFETLVSDKTSDVSNTLAQVLFMSYRMNAGAEGYFVKRQKVIRIWEN